MLYSANRRSRKAFAKGNITAAAWYHYDHVRRLMSKVHVMKRVTQYCNHLSAAQMRVA